MRSLLYSLLMLLGCTGLLEGRTVLISKSINYLEEIELEGVGKLIIKQGEAAGLQIEGEEEIIYDTKIKVQGGTLRITRKEGSFRKASSSLVCTVTVDNDLNKIILRGDAQLQTERLTLKDLQIDLHDRSSGALFLTGNNLLCRVFDKAQLTVDGSVKKQEVLVEDMAQYQGSGLESRICSVKVIGTGLAVVQAEDLLSAFVVGQGSIYYIREPKELEKRVSGTGQILKRL